MKDEIKPKREPSEKMAKCCLCDNEHPHPRGAKATDEGWMVFEGKMATPEAKKSVVLVFCPDHSHKETWAKILKEFPPQYD